VVTQEGELINLNFWTDIGDASKKISKAINHDIKVKVNNDKAALGSDLQLVGKYVN